MTHHKYSGNIVNGQCVLETHTHTSADEGEMDMGHLRIHSHRAAVETVLRKVKW